VVTLNMVQLMEALMGGSSSAQQGGTAAYLHTFTLQEPTTAVARGMTLQQNVALRGGTDKAKEIVGARPISATFSVGRGELLTSQFEFDGQKYDTSQTLASPSYVSGVPFHFGEAALKLGTYGAESAVTGVRAVSATVTIPQDTEYQSFGGGGLKGAPVPNAPVTISGTIDADYVATADFEDRFTGMTFPSLVFECVGAVATGKPAIASTYFPTWRLCVPGVHFTGPGQNNAGRDVPSNQWAWDWVEDGTNQPFIQVMSSETSV
jgi:Phage tail tube protein